MIPYEHSRNNRLLTQAKMSITSVITIHLCDGNIDYSHPLSPDLNTWWGSTKMPHYILTWHSKLNVCKFFTLFIIYVLIWY